MKSVMSRFKVLPALFFFCFVFLLFGLIGIPSNAYAAPSSDYSEARARNCQGTNQESGFFTDEACAANEAYRQGATSDLLQKCKDAPGGSPSVKNCAWSYQLCQRETVNQGRCGQEAYLSAISHCNGGKGESSGCPPIYAANQEDRTAFDKSITDKFNCDDKNRGLTSEQQKACNSLLESSGYCKRVENDGVGTASCVEYETTDEGIKAACQKEAGYSINQGTYGKYDSAKYQDCIKRKVREVASNSDVCGSGGGYWSSTENKCKSSRWDITSENDCTASGGGMTKDINGKITGKDGNKYRCDDKALTDALNKCEAAKDIQACKDGVLGEDCEAKYGQDADKTKLESCNQGKASAPVKPADPNKKDGTGTGERIKTAGEAGTCGKARTNLIVCDGEGMQALAGVLRIAIFVLTVIVGIAATGGIAYSAVLYAGAQDNAGNTQKAKEMIRNIVIGLIAYGFMIAIITWLVPAMNIKS